MPTDFGLRQRRVNGHGGLMWIFSGKESGNMNQGIKLAVIFVSAAMLAGGCAMGGATGEKTVAGNAALEREAYSEAAALFEEAVAEEEQPVLAWRGLGMAYMGLAQYGDAENAFQEALDNTDKRMPETIRDLQLYLASAQYRMDEYEEAISTCESILAKEEKVCSDAYFLRGAGYLKLGQKDEAKQDFDAAVALSPDSYDLYLNIYECYEEMNLSGLGTDYLQSALDIHGDETEDSYHRGRIYYYLEDYEKAQSELAAPVEAQYEPAMYLMGEVYLAKEDYVHAKNMYEQLRSTYGDTPKCCNGLALCAMKEGKYEEALAYLEQGLQTEDSADMQELYFNEMVAYEKKLDFETAKQKAEEYVARYPSDERGQKELIFLNTR